MNGIVLLGFYYHKKGLPYRGGSRNIDINILRIKDRSVFKDKQYFNKEDYPILYLKYNNNKFLCRIRQYGINFECQCCHKRLGLKDIRFIDNFKGGVFCLPCIENSKVSYLLDDLIYSIDGFYLVKSILQGNQQIIKECPFCLGKHYHGIPGGHVQKHCMVESHYNSKGYIVV